MVHGKLLKLAVAGVVAIAALAAVTSAVVIAGASGPSTTYYACLYKGKLTEVGTTAPTNCKVKPPISWNSQGPSGPPGANGVNGAPGSAGPQGPAGPGPIYIADNTNGTMSGSVDTPDVLATNVNGFDVHLSCAPNITFDTATVQATLSSSDPSIQTVSIYESSFNPGGSPVLWIAERGPAPQPHGHRDYRQHWFGHTCEHVQSRLRRCQLWRHRFTARSGVLVLPLPAVPTHLRDGRELLCDGHARPGFWEPLSASSVPSALAGSVNSLNRMTLSAPQGEFLTEVKPLRRPFR